jgi:DNA-binding NtrC family response regulator
MEPYRPRSRLGTSPDAVDAPDERELPIELGLSIRLDRPFHELKERLVSEFERAYLARCLAASENLSAASRMSGLSRKHLRTLMMKYGMVRRVVLESDDGSDPCSRA